MDQFIPGLNELSSTFGTISTSTGSRNVPSGKVHPDDHHDGLQPQSLDAQRNTVPAACVACRSKHLKCDGKMPCSRCVAMGHSIASCTYVRSRRGYKGPRRNPKQASETASNGTMCLLTTQADLSMGRSMSSGPSSVNGEGGVERTGSVTTDSGNSHTSDQEKQEAVLLVRPQEDRRAAADVEQYVIHPWSPASDLKNRCLEAFFHFFSQAHPFVLPKPYLTQMLRVKPLPQLEAAMRYIGSHYIKTAPTEFIAQEAMQLLSHRDCVRDGFTVQAMLLLAIGLDGNTEFDRANDMLKKAQDLALEIGMNHQTFAAMHGQGLAVLEESWRRTWWELYVVDGMIAGVHQRTSFRLNELPIEVLLPCEEIEYASGQIPAPQSFEEFEDQAFMDDGVTFSSFTYRIAAMRNLGRVLQMERIVFPDHPIVDQVDVHLVNWNLHLPESKRLAMDSDGNIDEMLFQGQMITTACTILVHRPLSQLDTSVARNVTSCAPHRNVAPGQIYNIHAAKIIQAAESISKLITLPVPLTRHTHFFTCVVTLASIVHLSYWAALLPLSYDENLKQQLRLNTGALKTLAEVWPSATRVSRQVKAVAQEVFTSRKLAASEGFWGALTEDEMMRSLIEDEGIINNFQLT